MIRVATMKEDNKTLSLFKENTNLLNKKTFNAFLKEIQDLLEIFIDNARKSHNTKISLKTFRIDNEDKFILESIILYFGKVIFMKYCIDNNFLSIQLKNNLYESMNEFYDKIETDFFDISVDEFYTYYIPPPHLDLQLLDLLTKYNFKGVDTDLIGKLYENFITKKEKILLGQVYTPDEVIDYILNNVGYTIYANIENKKIIDISCGSGAFIIRAANILIKNLKMKKYENSFILKTLQKNICGLDINPFALKLAELNMLLVTFELLWEMKKYNPLFKVQRFNLFITNSVDKKDPDDKETIYYLKNKIGEFANGFDFVVGNPPYLEAKKMPEQLKKICRANFPDTAKGAFDLYFCFIRMGLELLSKEGKLGYIIPNKLQVLKSARWLRKYILDNFSIEEITDISNLKVFKNISVYPILLFIENQKNVNNKIKTYDSIFDIEKIKSSKPIEIDQNNYRNTEDFIFYTLPKESTGLKIYEKMISQNHLLKEYLDIRWTVSFHKRGIINEFISKEPKGLNPKPILGADLYSKDSEVFQYKVKWNGFWIDYDRRKAKKIKNPFPPKKIFETPKLIIRQNAEKLTAAIDEEGKWYLKDVFFSGRLTEKAREKNISLEYIAAVLNSRLLNYYYSILFKGGHVNGGYLHFLVSYLNTLPIVLMTTKEQLEIVKMVKVLLEKYDEDIKIMIDTKICESYELSDTETNSILRRR